MMLSSQHQETRVGIMGVPSRLHISWLVSHVSIHFRMRANVRALVGSECTRASELAGRTQMSMAHQWSDF
jgi:hypothetical protein